jgi:hypothetical protein
MISTFYQGAYRFQPSVTIFSCVFLICTSFTIPVEQKPWFTKEKKITNQSCKKCITVEINKTEGIIRSSALIQGFH